MKEELEEVKQHLQTLTREKDATNKRLVAEVASVRKVSISHCVLTYDSSLAMS